MEAEGGEPQAPSYSSVTAKEHDSYHTKRPTFELPEGMQKILLEEEMPKEKPMDIDPAANHTKTSRTWEPGKCIPQAPIAPKYIINSPRIEDQKQYLRDFALIGKFLGLWPSEKDLIKWIQHWWKPKGHYDLQLGSKGFFTIILHNLEDRNQIFEGGPYFYNSVDLFLRFWMERFSPEKEDFTHAPVWLRLYSLPQEFWLEEILAGIDNTIGIYVKASEATKQRRYTAYARICVYLNISKPLPGAITLDYQDDEWSQTLDYEHIPFRCRKCHEHGHLFRECPLNNPTKPSAEDPDKSKDGFIPVTGKHRHQVKKAPPQAPPGPPIKNSFEVLQTPTDIPSSSMTPQTDPAKCQSTTNPDHSGPDPSQPPPSDASLPTTLGPEIGDPDTDLEDQELAGIDMAHLEQAYRKQQLYTIPPDQLRKVHKVFLNSSVGGSARANTNLGIQKGTTKDPRKPTKDEKKRGRKPKHQLIQDVGNFLVNSGQIQLISDSFPPLQPPPSL
jgi:hypothetical protein